jgi:dipeptidyl aminopeptidase/acylaminoacyl peptidase
MMGISDLATEYGTFDPRFRYDQPAYAASLFPLVAEQGQFRMGGPPWSDSERFIRNSPVFSANRITTPLMIIAGDVDSISTTQSEEMFTALNRQRKRCEFVRYLGEQHGIDSPANILDVWQRVFAWLDTYVKDGAEVVHH